jgi:hypothetical protein
VGKRDQLVLGDYRLLNGNTVEVKGDSRAARTGNFPFEFQHISGDPSLAWGRSCEATSLVLYSDFGDDGWPRVEYKIRNWAAARDWILARLDRYETRGTDGQTQIALVPWTELHAEGFLEVIKL